MRVQVSPPRRSFVSHYFVGPIGAEAHRPLGRKDKRDSRRLDGAQSDQSRLTRRLGIGSRGRGWTIEFKKKKVVLVSVPGAFTPTCQKSHLPSYIQNKEALKAKGVDQVVVIAFNDPFVMSAWGKANGIKDDFILFASDDAGFSKSIGWTVGERTARYAIAIDHGKVVYAGRDDGTGSVDASGAEAVLSKL